MNYEIRKPCSSVAAPEQGKSRAENATMAPAQSEYSVFPEGLQGRLALRPTELAEVLGVGRNCAYELCQRADFPVIKVGNKLIVPVDGLRRWLDDQAVRK